MQLNDITFTGDDGLLFPAVSIEAAAGRGEDELPESGALTATNPNININFVPHMAGQLHYVVRTNGSSGGERSFSVPPSLVGCPITIWGAAQYDFNSPSESQACEISLAFDRSWLIARF